MPCKQVKNTSSTVSIKLPEILACVQPITVLNAKCFKIQTRGFVGSSEKMKISILKCLSSIYFICIHGLITADLAV